MSGSDIYDIAGHLVEVAAPPGAGQDAVRRLFGGFVPVEPAPAPDAEPLPRYDVLVTPQGDWRIVVGAQTIGTGTALTDVLAALEWHVVVAAVERRRDAFHLHGAALCLPDRDAAIALVGRSGAGKTTLALRLMADGFTPFTDDVMLIAPGTLDVQPFRRAFHVDETSWQILGDTDIRSDGARDMPTGYFTPNRWAARPVPLAWVLFLERRPGEASSLTPLQPADAATVLLRETLTLERAPRLALSTVARLTQQARCYRFITGELESAVAAVQQLLAVAPGDQAVIR